MVDFSSPVNGMEKLNDFNYNNWSTCMRYYLLGQDLWDIVGGNNTTPPTNDSDLRKWNVKSDPENAISETRMRRIILHGLRPEYNGIVTATRGWANEPTLTELENILANQEALDKQIPKVSIKEDESALFSNKRRFKGQNRNRAGARDGKPWKNHGDWWRQPEKKGYQPGGARQDRDDNDDEDKTNKRRSKRCYICGKVGHIARFCWYRREEGNVVTSCKKEIESEEEWDFQVPVAMKEQEELATACIVELDNSTSSITTPNKSKPRENSKKQLTMPTSSHENKLHEMQDMIKKLKVEKAKVENMLKKRDEMIRQKDRELKAKERELEKFRCEFKKP
ncbi:uncharacterized protein LOC120289716 [Eucalyptus grandis]|uniref:uncharacterized protein LOC120289716 n=1 Tax=Eucalyptus grandis TaxID=71139 RepID=UPI00192E9A9B|nr:uncharacterized protein LOC120289716 [Eucalyptus grandis]